MNSLIELFNRYPRREQLALFSLAMVLAVFVLWVVLLNPLQKKRAQLTAANAATSQSLGKVRIMAAQIQQLRSQGSAGNSSDNINGIIDSSLRANGLTMSGFQPGAGGEVRLRLERASYTALMQWLHEIEFKQGISVRDLSIAATNDPGLLMVNLRLHKAQ